MKVTSGGRLGEGMDEWNVSGDKERKGNGTMEREGRGKEMKEHGRTI